MWDDSDTAMLAEKLLTATVQRDGLPTPGNTEEATYRARDALRLARIFADELAKDKE